MNTSFTKIFLLLIIALFVLPSPASAHLIGGNGFMSGVTHPLFGLDHLLAMVAVGVISTQLGRRAIWIVPATFVITMVIGGMLAIAGVRLPFVETGIALSVLFLGIVIAVSKKFPLLGAMACVALFAIFHGHAHGEEMPGIANPALYALGFVLSTTLLHISGVFIGHYAKKTTFSTNLLRYSGAIMSLVGLFFLLGY